MMEEAEITGRRILRKILGQIKDGDNTEDAITMDFIHILRKLQAPLGNKELLFMDTFKESIPIDLHEDLSAALKNWKLPIRGLKKLKNGRNYWKKTQNCPKQHWRM